MFSGRLKTLVSKTLPTQIATQSRRVEILTAEIQDMQQIYRKCIASQTEQDHRTQLGLASGVDPVLSKSGQVLVEAIESSTSRSLHSASEITEIGSTILSEMRQQRDILKVRCMLLRIIFLFSARFAIRALLYSFVSFFVFAAAF